MLAFYMARSKIDNNNNKIKKIKINPKKCLKSLAGYVISNGNFEFDAFSYIIEQIRVPYLRTELRNMLLVLYWGFVIFSKLKINI